MADDPLDYSLRYNTVLTPEEEAAYQAWAQQNSLMQDVYDYDMRGFYKSGESQSENAHFPDTYKKPNHPTFSNESIYNGIDGHQGGQWGDRSFTPGPTNMAIHGLDELFRYFKTNEPDYKLDTTDALLNKVQ